MSSGTMPSLHLASRSSSDETSSSSHEIMPIIIAPIQLPAVHLPSSSAPSSLHSSPIPPSDLLQPKRRIRRVRSRVGAAARSSANADDSASSSSSSSNDSLVGPISFNDTCTHAASEACCFILSFLSTPERTVPLALILFSVAYLLLFDLRTHLILLCAILGWVLMLLSGALIISKAGGIIAFLSPTTQHMLLDYNLLELIKISWHSRTLQDILSLVIFPLSRAERKRIIQRLPSKLSSVLTRRGIIHLLPRTAKKIIGSGTESHHHHSHDSDATLEQVNTSMLSSSSQPNLTLLDSLAFPTVRPSPAGSPQLGPLNGGGIGHARSRSLTALVDAEDEASVDAVMNNDQHDGLRRRRKTERKERGVEMKEAYDSEESEVAETIREEMEVHASIVTTSSSSSSSRSESSTPDLRDADVRNYDECTPSPARLFFSSKKEQQQAFSFPTSNPSSVLIAAPSSSPASYRAPISTFLPLPSSVDDLNFARLLERQIREHAKEGMKNMARVVYEGVQETIEDKWKEVKCALPASVLPYLTWQHMCYLGPLSSSLIIAQLSFRSQRFRAAMMRFMRFGLDCGILSAAVYAAITAYHELTVSMQTQILPPQPQPSPRSHILSSRSSSPHASSSNSPATLVAVSSSPAAQLPSFSLYRRMHALPAVSQASSLLRAFHSLRVFLNWLHLRYRTSGPLRISTLVLAVWFAWLARNTSIVRTQKERLIEKVKHMIENQH